MMAPSTNNRCKKRLTRSGFIAALFLIIYLIPHHGTKWLQPLETESSQLRLSSLNDGGANEGVNPLPLCKPLDVEAAKTELVCLPKCRPSPESTLEGMGLDPRERANISIQERQKFWTYEYGKYRIYFPEEDIYLNLTEHFANEIQTEMKSAGVGTMGDRGSKYQKPVLIQEAWQPRAFTERLLRRIVARLLRAGIMDPSHDIVNTGSWIGDNALPWALLLQNLNPTNPGRIIAVDPSINYVTNMANMSNVNGVGNLCTRIGVFSSKEETITANSLEHMTMNLNAGRGQIELTTIPIDSLQLEHVSLLHLDVEGHESEVIEGALDTINTTRPIIITEGYNIWPEPEDWNDRQILRSLSSLGYLWYDEIPEKCGWNVAARNMIWWPDEETRNKAMEVVGKEFERALLPWISFDLPEAE